MRTQLIGGLLVIAGLVGCGKEEAKPSPAAAENRPAPQKPIQQVNMNAKLEYGLEIKPSDSNPPKYIVTWTVTAPTGGWKLTTDSTRVEEKHRELRMDTIFVTLEEPADGEVTTPAVTTISGQHDAGTELVNGAELWVRRRVKGVIPTYAESYGQVKTAGKQY